jgi:outer membrane protein assembly factor BamB
MIRGAKHMKLIALTYACIALSGGACRKSPMKVDNKNNNPNFSYYKDTIVPIIWESTKDANRKYVDANSIEIGNGRIFTTGNYKLESYDVLNGNPIQSDIIPTLGNIKSFLITTQSTVVARGANSYGIYGYPNFNLLKQYPSIPTFEYCDDYYYDSPNATYRFYSSNDDSSASISLISNGVEKVLFKDTSLWKNNYVAGIPTYFWTKPNGDSCLVMSPTLLERAQGNQNHTALCVYNLKTKQIEWSFIDFDYSGLGLSFGVKDNKFYCSGPRHLYCYDLINKTKVWEYDFRLDDSEGGFGYVDNTPIFYDTDKMYIHSTSKMAYSFNINTGQVIWKTVAGYAPGKKVEYNGVIYYRGIGLYPEKGSTAGAIIGIRKTDGKVVFSHRSPDDIRNGVAKGESWQCNDIALDTQRGWIVGLTPSYMVCLDISKIQ